MELHRFFRYAIEKMCKEKKSLNHFIYTKHKNAKESKQKQKSPYGKSHSPITNSLFHTVGYKNHSVGYIFHSVGYKSRTVKQRI